MVNQRVRNMSGTLKPNLAHTIFVLGGEQSVFIETRNALLFCHRLYTVAYPICDTSSLAQQPNAGHGHIIIYGIVRHELTVASAT